MGSYILRRILVAIPTLFIISIVNFIIFNAPPGDFASVRVAMMESRMGGTTINTEEAVQALRKSYGLDKPLYARYLTWIWGFVRGELGESFLYSAAQGSATRSVNELIKDRLFYTVLMSFLSLVFINVIAIPIALWVSTHQYKLSDYLFTFLGFIGMATPSFLLALIALWIAYNRTGQAMFGLFSDQFLSPGWSLLKFMDLLKHLVIPMIIIGIAGTASTIRILRATMLDELGAEYIKFERSKGLRERTIVRHAFRVASNPIVSGLGSLLPSLIAGELLASLVLGLPTLGPIFYEASVNQDIYLASSYLMIVTILLVIGNLLADVLLAWLDPRIRF
jgi:peptide/nickel transport system permease protein